MGLEPTTFSLTGSRTTDCSTQEYRVPCESRTHSNWCCRPIAYRKLRYIAAETGIEPISSESESDVIPLHYSAIQGRRDLNPYYESQSPVYLPFVRHPTIKWKEKESNLRRAGLQPAALPTWAIFPKEKPPALIRQVVSTKQYYCCLDVLIHMIW